MSSSSGPEKVSFTIRRPTPVSRASSAGNDSDSGFKVPSLPRHLANETSHPGSPLARSVRSSPKRTYNEVDSSDEETEDQDELVTGFDSFGVQRVIPQLTVALFFDSLHEKKKQPEGPLVIPALKNRDWRDLARKRKQIYLPPSSSATTGADGSVGGLGTRDSINSGPQLSGLQLAKKPKLEDGAEVKMEVEEQETVSAVENHAEEDVKEEELTEDQKAIRAILAAAKNPNHSDEPQIEIIPVSEEDALRQDLTELPDSASLDDYERVPVSQFGAALLRGMGWTDGTAASRKKGADGKPKGLTEPWLPQARPALLGIGAKEKEVFDDGSGKGKKFRPDKKYMPLLKVEKNGSRNGSEDRDTRSGSGSSSRRRSPSPSHSSSKKASRRSPSPDRRRDRDRHDSDNRRRDDYRDRDRERERDRDRDRDRRKDYESNSSRRDRDRDSDRRRDRSSERHRDSSSRRRDY
ncbi:hypothetical protein QCA50_011946 [Cerrena zonata]|uniref:Spp2/MOS2 G-patch domain-containing protein n=1 Tax=Cerrena zonata TaxID=2478898 RepID=A0AAW0G621_9APHY